MCRTFVRKRLLKRSTFGLENLQLLRKLRVDLRTLCSSLLCRRLQCLELLGQRLVGNLELGNLFPLGRAGFLRLRHALVRTLDGVSVLFPR